MQFAFYGRQDGARVTFVSIRRKMAQVDNISIDIMIEVEFIEADESAVQMKRIPVFSHIESFAVQGELGVGNSVGDASHECSEVRIVRLSVAGDVVES